VAEYRLHIKPSAAKEIEGIRTKRDRQRLVVRIQSVAAEPRLAGYEKLAGIASRYRIRQGPYRVVYLVDDARRLVEVVKMGRRREIYRSTS
jgi:mRNA interferase RelE/StbE